MGTERNDALVRQIEAREVHAGLALLEHTGYFLFQNTKEGSSKRWLEK